MLKDQVLISDRKINCVRFRLKESYPHRLRKFEVCNWLYDNGYSFLTEAEFSTGGRPDIIVWNADWKSFDEFIVEVVHSEKEISILKKKDKYPTDDIRVVKTSKQFEYKDIQ